LRLRPLEVERLQPDDAKVFREDVRVRLEGHRAERAATKHHQRRPGAFSERLQCKFLRAGPGAGEQTDIC